MTTPEPTQPRRVEQILAAQPTIEGAGVHLRRAFGQREAPRLDPFLLLDDLRSENPADYAAGFPWHPHRGIETVTYVLGGRVDHEDSLGNRGTIGAGDVQWMTAGSGIIHQEMPQPLEGRMGGFQLWVNLPASHKMMDPRYQEIASSRIPEVELARGVRVRVVAGEVAGVRGPVRDILVAPTFLDVRMEPGTQFDLPLPNTHRAFAYALEGRGVFDAERAEPVDADHLVVFRAGERVQVEAPLRRLRFLFVAGQPLGQPVAWWGPIVMNHRRQLEEAILEFQAGTFIREKGKEDAGPTGEPARTRSA